MLESAVIGVPSDLTDEDLCAFVVLRPGHTASPQDLAWCLEDRIAYYKVPRVYRVVAALPKTGTHIVRKDQLRAIAGTTDGGPDSPEVPDVGEMRARSA